jgi:type VI secretion system protein ImpH
MDTRGDEQYKQGVIDKTKTSSPVIDKLYRKGYKFNFFQAVNLLERLYRMVERDAEAGNSESEYTEYASPGGDGPLSQEAIRFQASVKLSFPSADISRIDQIDHNSLESTRMILTFMGLYGVSSPLPPYFSQMLAELDDTEEYLGEEEDTEEGIKALRLFLDIFNHRTYSLFYRGWKKYRYHLQFEAEARDRFSQYMLSLIGLGTPALQEAVGVDVPRLIAYSGHLGQRMRNSCGLQNMLRGYFGGIHVKITEFMPRWVPIPEQYRAHLDRRVRLGENFTIGQKIRDVNGKFRITLGPLSLQMFRDFLPRGQYFRELNRIVKFYAPDQLSFDVELLLRKEDVPPMKLSAVQAYADPNADEAAQLGWTSWLGKPIDDIVSVVTSGD